MIYLQGKFSQPQVIAAGVAYGAGAAFTLAAGQATTVAGATFLKVLGFAVEAGITYAIARLLDRHKKDDTTTGSPTYGEQDAVSQQTIPYQRILVGEFTVELDARCVLETSREGAPIPADLLNDPDREQEFYTGDAGPYLVEMYLICNHETEGLTHLSYIGPYSRTVTMEFDQNHLIREGTGESKHSLYQGGNVANEHRGPYLGMSFRNGQNDQALDPILERNFPNAKDDELYGANFRQRGHTTVTLESYYGKNSTIHSDVWGDVPNFRARVKGAKVFDPRDSDQHPDRPWTWKFSKNPVLIGHWLLQNKDFLGEQTVTYNDFDFDAMKANADICDLGMFTRDGRVIPQYEANMYFHLGERPLDVMQEILASCNGLLLYKNGSLHIEPGAPKEPVDVMTDDDIIGGLEYMRFTPASETVTRIVPRGIIPEANYQYESAPNVEEDTGQVVKNEIAVNFRAVEDSSRIQRIALTQLREANEEKGLRVICGPRAEYWQPGDVIISDPERFQFIRNVHWQLRNRVPGEITDSWECEFVEWDNARFEWNPDTDEKPLDLRRFRTL